MVDLKDFFSHIVMQKDLAHETHYGIHHSIKEHHAVAVKRHITFDYRKINTVLWNEVIQNQHYMLGKIQYQYFLATQKGIDVFPCVEILLHDTLSELVYRIPGISNHQAFGRTILLAHRLENQLKVKTITQKVSKI